MKRARECLQIETQENKKKRIIYIDPNHISVKKLVARKVSHKPPQIFSSRLGGDPHEKYHTGQPFSSDRKANFSSRYIPLFSSLIDNFRIHVKLSKVRAAEGKNRNAICQIAKAIDPGAEGTFSTISGIVKTKRESCRNKIKNKDDLYCRNLNLLKSNFSQFSKLVNIACEKKCGSDLSKIFLCLIKEIKPKEAIHLSSSQKIAAFFGIASGGIPFFTGWFVGIIGELSIKNHLTISKTENENIKLSFHNRCKVGAIGLVGTGQGLEKTLLKTSGLDYLTVLPVEANIIMMIQCGFDDDFSFEMTKENFEKFVTQLSDQEEDSEFKKFIISEAEAIQNKETEFVIKIEAKSELRLQAGKKVNAITYMVMPRTAVGAKLALNLLNVNYASKSRGNKNNEFLLPSKNLKITALKPELDFFADWKVMPIVMQPGQSQKLWCYPLPLLEEAKPIRSLSADGFTLIETAESDKGENTFGNDFFTISRVNKVNKIPVFVKINEKNDLKNGLNLKQISKYNNIVNSINEELIKIKKNLICQEVSSQHKLCVINVISHYEYIESKINSKERLKDSVESVILSKMEKGNCNKKSFKLKKLEFRKITSLSIVKATIPIPILNFSNVNDIVHDQYLGEIEFLYHKNSDIKPFDAERRINFLY